MGMVAMGACTAAAHHFGSPDAPKAGSEMVSIINGTSSGPVELDAWKTRRVGLPNVVTTADHVWRVVVAFIYGILDCLREETSPLWRLRTTPTWWRP
ncbi:hypothetical protein HYH02_003245 [Chlamydomonas schloesseri]|uniref:Uncharacterized protein n=1 Tax=Chlamydomonas schloesseri TaxID=2026947 RepID=A0A835WR73_9CHLO|nr:hypothetical protein HYH02_003245 [Chlamydomonas schloesseri]|eukprot:KAG2452215.1 hypothetical protein HYH02_003245 [Chlamydomonas schloesseri]